MSLYRVFERWFTRDRIRISPFEGAILCLAEGDLVRIGKVAYQITRRALVPLATKPTLVYDCVSAIRSVSLRIEAGTPKLRIVLIHDHGELDLHEDDVEAFPRTNHV